MHKSKKTELAKISNIWKLTSPQTVPKKKGKTHKSVLISEQ